MSAEADFIEAFCRKNPLMRGTEKLQLTPERMVAIIRQAYKAGYSDGKASKSLFEEIFGPTHAER